MIMHAIAHVQSGGAEQRMDAQRRLDSLDRQLADKDREDDLLIKAYCGGAMNEYELKDHRQQVAVEKHGLIQERLEAEDALCRIGASAPSLSDLGVYVARAQEHLKTGSLADKRAVIERLGISFVWTPGQPIIIRGKVPGATADTWVAWEDSLDIPEKPLVQVAERIKAMVDVEGQNFAQIARVLQAEGIPTKRGRGRWRRTSVYRLYAGLMQP
jgi:hypothetical protein